MSINDINSWDSTPAFNRSGRKLYFSSNREGGYGGTDIYEATMTVDVSLGYALSDNLKLSIGANNLFNKYPTPQFDGWTDQGGLADSVQMGSDGMYLFSRLSFNF